jgi:hypothetical protein
MHLPCEYCGKLVQADEFMRLCVPPCCADCTWAQASGRLAAWITIILICGALIYWLEC